MTSTTLGEAFELNPTMKLTKGTNAPFVDMASLVPFTRDVSATQVKPYGGGMKFCDGDVLMARITPSLENGKTSVYRAAANLQDTPAFGSTEFIVIRGKEGISSTDFAYYLFTSPEIRDHAISSMNGSSGRQRVQHDSLSSFEIDLPELEEQRAIAATLGALDDKIESNQRICLCALGLADQLFLFALEAGQREVEVDEVADFHNRRRIPLSNNERLQRAGNIPYYGATGVFGHVNEALFDEILVLVGEDGSVVRQDGGPVLQYIWGPAWINNHAHPLTARGVSNETLFLALNRTDIRPIVTGAAQPKVNMRNLKSLLLNLPTDVRELEQKLNPLFELYRSKQDEIVRLKTLRDALLPELLSGRIRAGDLEAAS